MTRNPQRWQGLFARRFQGSSTEAGKVSGATQKIPRGDTMRVGFDLDGTVADLQSALAREAVELFPEIDPASLPRSAAPDSDREHTPYTRPDEVQVERVSISALSHGQQRELWKTVCARVNFWETLDEIEPGVLARLFTVASQRRWEVIFLTSRPQTAGYSAQQQSHRWLVANGFLTPSVFVVHGSRGKIAESLGLDMIVDDRPENCLDIAMDSKARAVLVWRDEEGKVPSSARQLGIGSVSSIANCLDILESIGRSDAEGDGVVERLKRRLGLRPQAGEPPPQFPPQPQPLLAHASGLDRRR